MVHTYKDPTQAVQLAERAPIDILSNSADNPKNCPVRNSTISEQEDEHWASVLVKILKEKLASPTTAFAILEQTNTTEFLQA